MKKFIPIIAVALVVGGASFYGGMTYAGNKAAVDRQERMQQFGANAGAGFRSGAGQRDGQGGFTAGEIIAKDDKSVTIKIQDARLPDGQGGSKIIFLSDSTKIAKSTDGALSDLEVGKNISVNGVPNSDGSITAQTIQLLPQP
ncbi:hypothetical protein A3G55_02825 [Candidatus Giovannonibacteria bacterium RIFCSPLOWO2_12_FULL_44_25]|uniref:Uncharacterized protein n=4 Tax=Parcubacteria group TaxID=1794811 RepID=A0A0G1ID04_9BACT|nr:MAG: hypothetical protein UW15_C0014G0029 [Parcubacteria group bacterium GW2011_GWC1_44_10]KKT57085.1 MAG: hypothetical protein UW49_C0008G0047 [Candidatus Giovannonibacteria bacterium GW2011_GWB1_44_23]KKT59522.1 MAG: hypothetical protein UW53_C0011G0051 [Candidatus Giovannonibacteria bacterium GW2011_GWA1_44_25]OGF49969.1 MAG: hypothetical protein A2120_04650 [Candidatus Giovannonibacteria bacterium GWA2_45_15]OGF59278.1 MAG: hypothetical protein A2W40_03830 [Candidatus Giovannonibacteria 